MENFNSVDLNHSSHVNVIAAVVTFNRKELLLRCLRHILLQTFSVKEILVVDNCSTDGSEEYIKSNIHHASIRIKWFRHSKNEGGAGGFFSAYSESQKLNPDYIWVMDDDGYPANNCLENLLKTINENLYIGPLVLSNEKSRELSFPIRIPGTLSVFKTERQLQELLKGKQLLNDVISAFNGVLITTSLLQKVGYPKKDFFIWGDETEFVRRIMKNNGKVAINTEAIFFHPIPNIAQKKMFFGKLIFNDPQSVIKLYCFCRNGAYIKKKYDSILHAFLFACKVLWFYSLTSPSASKLVIVCRGLYDGFRNNFRNTNKYLK